MANYDQPEGKDNEDAREIADAQAEEVDISQFDQDAPNLVPFFMQSDEGKDFLKKVAEQACSHTQTGWDQSEEYREKRKRNYQMLTGFMPKRSSPIDGGADVHTPLMLERWLRLTSNVYVELFEDKDIIFTVQPTGPDDYEQAELLTLHGNWQLKNELTDFFRQQERGVQEFFSAGSTFCYSWRDTVKNRNRHDILTCEDLVIPYVHTSYEVDMSDVPWKARWVRKYRPELEDLRDREEWFQVDEVLEKGPPAWDIIETKVRDQGARGEGIIAPETAKDAPYVFIEYHGYIRMPGAKSQRPICVTVDKQNKVVVKLYIAEEEDWQDRARYDREVAELEQYRADMEQHQLTMSNEMALREQLMSPEILPGDADEMLTAFDEEPLLPPVPPKWLEGKSQLPPEAQQPDPIKRVPMQMFSHGVCIENPFGVLGLAPGQILADLNRLADEALNALYDAASLGNAWTLVTREGVDFGSTQVPMGVGKHLKVRGVTGENLERELVQLKPSQANPQLMDIVRMCKEDGDSSIAAPGVLSGEAGKSGETFRGLATRREQAMRQLSKAGIKYLSFFGQILKNNARLNSLFMPDEQAIMVLDHFASARSMTVDPATGAPQPEIVVGRDMYRRNYSVTFEADVKFAPSAQKIAEADEIVAMGQMPQLAGNLSFQYAAISKALRARGKHDMIATLGPAPPPPETPLGMPDPMMMGGPPPMGPDGLPLAEEAGAPPEDGPMMPAGEEGPIQGPQPEVGQ